MSKDIQLVSSVASIFLKDVQIRVVPIFGKGNVNKVFIVETPNAKFVVRMGDQNESLKELQKGGLVH